jgi:formylglycine-generating enzyme required for sulfatase activity
MTAAVEFELREIPQGSFSMGSDEGQADEQPIHRVWVDAFSMARFPVTTEVYLRFVKSTGHRLPAGWEQPRFRNPDQPVVGVSWFDATGFCAWVARTTGQPYRLPTEAEREKAALGGNTSRYPWGDRLPSWAERDEPLDGPSLVGSDAPNGYDLHNMGDLVHEWCSDWYAANYYGNAPERNPEGPPSGHRRSSRGGSWRHSIPVTRCAARSSIPPDKTYTDYGFRVVLAQSIPEHQHPGAG